MSGDDTVILRTHTGADEVNARCVSYRVNRWNCVRVPEEDVAPLLKTGGFYRASEDDPSALNASLSDVLDVAWHLPKGNARSTLLAILRSPNSMNHLIQSLAFT